MNIKKIALSVVFSAVMLITGSFAQSKSENKMLRSSMHARIINGTPVLEDDDSWRSIVALKDGDFQFCAGSLIAENWVLTAAHCVEYSSPSDFTIGVNSYDKTTTTAYNVEEVIVHSNYDNDIEMDNDIALVKLSTPVTTVTPISYRTNPNEITGGTNTKIAGWGRTETGMSSDALMEISVPIISRDDCNASSSYDGRVSDNMICAGYIEGGTDSCKGDSGGPLVIDNELAGIVSWGDGCALKNSPGVYTNVKQYASWISDHIGGGDQLDSTIWTKRPYENNEDETKQLCVDGADNIKVKITGEIEANYDFLRIYTTSGDELAKVSGILNEELTVAGSCISTHFTSDYSITKKGLTITVKDTGQVDPSATEWINRPYENNEDETRELCVDGADSIRVAIQGEIESGYDFLSISDNLGNELEKLTDSFAMGFIVEGNCISAHFTSDGSVTKEGFTIIVDEAPQS